jgi:hypothetical protein
MTLAVFGGRENILLFSSIIISFAISQTTLFAYGFITGQLGFVLIPIYQLFLTIITFIYLNQNPAVYEDIDED